MLHCFFKDTSDAVVNQISLHMLQLLEQNIITLVKTELQNLQKSLNCVEGAGVQRLEQNLAENQEENGEESSRDNLMKIIVKEIKSIGDTELADYLHNSKLTKSLLTHFSKALFSNNNLAN